MQIRPTTIILFLLLLIALAGTGWYLYKTEPRFMALFQGNAEEEADAYPGEVRVDFRGDVTKEEAAELINDRGLSVKIFAGDGRESLRTAITFREFASPYEKLPKLFAYLEGKSLVEECSFHNKDRKWGTAECEFRSNISRDEVTGILLEYPDLGLYTDEPSPPMIFWPETSFLRRVLVSVPIGEEHKWARKLEKTREVESASVTPVTVMPGFMEKR